MARREPRPPRRPMRWAPKLAFGAIIVGIAAALCLALFPVHSSGHQHVEGCGDAAAAIVINGEGSNVTLGGIHQQRTGPSGCYRRAEKRVLIAGAVLVTPFAAVVIALLISRSGSTGSSRRSD